MCNKRRNLKKLALNLSPGNVEKNEYYSNTTTNHDGDTKLNNKHNTSGQLYEQGPVCILPNLYLGAHYNASNSLQVERYGITCIINVAREVHTTTTPLAGVRYHHIQWTHAQSDLARSEFDKAIQIILAAHDNHQTVLIHCQQGIERSAALVLAFLLYTARAGTLARAFQYVQEKAPQIRPNMELLYQLREYEQQQQRTTTLVVKTRTRRSESVTSHPTFSKKTQRPRSSSSSSSLETVRHPPKKTTTTKHALAMTCLLVVLSAMYQVHKSSSTTTLFLKTVYSM